MTSIVQRDTLIVSASRDRGIKLWNNEGQLIKSINSAHADWIIDLKLIPSRNAIVSLARDGSIQVRTLL